MNFIEVGMSVWTGDIWFRASCCECSTQISVLVKWGKFLSIWENVILSRRILLHGIS